MCAKYFLQIHLFKEIIAVLAIYYVDMKNKLMDIVSISTEQCHKNSISKSHNGPIIGYI